MSAEFQSIDEAINASYQSASQVETMARQLEARISKIDGAKRHLPHRNYGQPVDLGKIRANLTLTSLQRISLKAEHDKQFSASVGALRLLYDILLARKLDNEAIRARRTTWGNRHGNTKF